MAALDGSREERLTRTNDAWLAGRILAAFGYVEQSAVQSAEAVTGIRLMVSVFPGLLSILCAALLLLYRLDAATCRQMQDELEARRADVPDSPSTLDPAGGSP